jgi:hypothetical protein
LSTGYRPQRYREAIPRIDGRSEVGQIDDLLLAEMRLRLFVHAVGHVRLRDQRDRFDPCPVSPAARIDRVHVDAVRTAVDP